MNYIAYKFTKNLKYYIMNNEEKTKQAWQTPEIVELDVDKTEKFYGSPENATWSS